MSDKEKIKKLLEIIIRMAVRYADRYAVECLNEAKEIAK